MVIGYCFIWLYLASKNSGHNIKRLLKNLTFVTSLKNVLGTYFYGYVAWHNVLNSPHVADCMIPRQKTIKNVKRLRKCYSSKFCPKQVCYPYNKHVNLVLEAVQTNAFNAKFTCHPTPCFFLSFQTAFAATFRVAYVPVPSIEAPRTNRQSLGREITDQLFDQI